MGDGNVSCEKIGAAAYFFARMRKGKRGEEEARGGAIFEAKEDLAGRAENSTGTYHHSHTNAHISSASLSYHHHSLHDAIAHTMTPSFIVMMIDIMIVIVIMMVCVQGDQYHDDVPD